MDFVFKDGKKLKTGYTTGSCAAGAAKASLTMLFSKTVVEEVSILTPKGITLKLKISNQEMGNDFAISSVTKFSGDDPDITNGAEIFCKAEKNHGKGIVITGGKGVGIVTKKGLSLPVGSYAINEVPRKMITDEALNVCKEFDKEPNITLTISVPKGEELAKKTYNPRLGIEGGISILGTSGIVVPMSSEALLKTIELEINQQKSKGKTCLLLCPGNYGEDFIKTKTKLSVSLSVKCSNFIGDSLDIAFSKGFKDVLLIGHIGKLTKLGGGIMNTHSRNADCRMEIIASNAIYFIDNIDLIKSILSSNTTNEAAEILEKNGILHQTFERITNKAKSYLDARYNSQMNIELIMFSEELGIIGKTKGTDDLIEKILSETKNDLK